MARTKTPKQLEREREHLFARLRANGEDEMNRRWRDAERRGVLARDPNRIFFLVDVEKTAMDTRPERIRKIEEMFGEREAEFRQGIAQQALHLLQLVLGRGYRLGELGKGEWFEMQRRERERLAR